MTRNYATEYRRRRASLRRRVETAEQAERRRVRDRERRARDGHVFIVAGPTLRCVSCGHETVIEPDMTVARMMDAQSAHRRLVRQANR